MPRTSPLVAPLALALSFALSLVLLPAPGHGADGDCTLATSGDSPVAKACKQGGVKEAKKEMKRLVKEAKAKGMKTECDTCHPNDDYGKLTEDGRAQFEKMVKLVGG